MKILILSTGGTIGSELNGSVVEAANNSYNLCSPLCDYYYTQKPESKVTFITKSVLNILSENIIPENRRLLYEYVCENLSLYDFGGIIITHGTDTLAYTSIFLALMLEKPKVPVALVSSNSPLSDKKATGYKNFTAAVDFITNENVKCVFVPAYKNGKTYIHLGSRFTQAQPFTHSFRSLGDIYFGIMDKNGFHRNNHKYNPSVEELNGTKQQLFSAEFSNTNNIIYIKSFPGLNYDMIDFKEKPAAILHELYHSGTACINSDKSKYSVVNFAKKCIDCGIDFYAAPFDSRYAIYSTSKEMQKAGIKFIGDMSAEAAYVKLSIAYGIFKNKTDITDFIEKNIAFEKLF